MSRVLIAITAFLIPVLVIAAADDRNYGNVVVSEVTSIYDGDTFRANINAWPEIIGYHISVRVDGIDTPEMEGACEKEKDAARRAKQFTVDFLRNGKVLELRNIYRDKYFRLRAEVYADGKSLGDALLQAGLARGYHGETRGGWCHGE